MKDYINGQLAVRDERLRGIDEATRLRLSQVTDTHEAIQEDIDRAVGARAAVMEERLRGIDIQFSERDTRAERESRDNKVAVDAAFAAQKEAATKQDEANAKAIDKSERATAETIKTNQELNKATTDGLTKSLDEVKTALTRIESRTVGAQENRTQTGESRTTLVAIVGVITLVIGTVIGALVGILTVVPGV
jgi:hypothetical protein